MYMLFSMESCNKIKESWKKVCMEMKKSLLFRDYICSFGVRQVFFNKIEERAIKLEEKTDQNSDYSERDGSNAVLTESYVYK